MSDDSDRSYKRVFTGQGKDYWIACTDCVARIESRQARADELSTASIDEASLEFWNCAGHCGLPELKEKETNLWFSSTKVKIPFLDEMAIIAAEVDTSKSNPTILILNSQQEILSIDLYSKEIKNIFNITACNNINLDKEIRIHVSQDSNFIGIMNSLGQYGYVIDVDNHKITTELNRGDYCIENCIFPFAFFSKNNVSYYVHATSWNRLDISHSATGRIISDRETNNLDHKNERYLDYFHSDISVSDDGKYIIDNGWAWHPIGIVSAWDLNKWFTENVWESENGDSKIELYARNYYWHGKTCWINSETIALYGFGEDEEWIIPAVRLYNIKLKKEVNWFPGPSNNLFFDGNLFSYSADSGCQVWDIESGELLHTDRNCRLGLYHRHSKKFITINEDSTITLMKLKPAK